MAKPIATIARSPGREVDVILTYRAAVAARLLRHPGRIARRRGFPVASRGTVEG